MAWGVAIRNVKEKYQILYTMSQNKTRFPGMEYDEQEKENATSNVYSRGAYSGKRKRMTQIPGMTDVVQPDTPTAINPLSGKPIRGFLYSISRGVVGEFWPLRQGKNTIGSSPKCDICLPEATVSEEHASITIRILEAQGKTIASLKDTDSTNGTKINGADIDFDANPVKNGDIIRFGLNYECLLLIIDTDVIGLKVSKDFIPTDMEPEVDDSAPIVYQRGNATGTVAMDGNPTQEGESRHTVLM